MPREGETMSEESRRIAEALAAKLADSIGNPGRVWCRECGRSVTVNAAVALQSGWPKCHGLTMTIDHPSTWDDSPARRRALEAEAEAERARQAEEARDG